MVAAIASTPQSSYIPKEYPRPQYSKLFIKVSDQPVINVLNKQKAGDEKQNKREKRFNDSLAQLFKMGNQMCFPFFTFAFLPFTC